MRLSIQSYLSALFLPVLLAYTSPASGACLPKRNIAIDSRQSSPKVAEIHGLEVLRTYVCPTSANSVKRQVNIDNGPTNTTIPISQVAQLFTEVQKILAQLEAILEAEGLVNASASASVASSSSATASSVRISSVATSSTRLTVTSTSNFPTTVTIRLIAATTTSGTTNTAIATDSLGSSSIPSTAASISTSEETGSTNVCKASILETVTVTLDGSVVATITATSGVAALSSTTENVVALSTASPDLTSSSSTAPTATTALESSRTGGVFIETLAGTGTGTGTTSSSAQATATATSSYVFNATSNQNVAVYFGQTAITGTTSLAAQCADPDIDIAILAFVVASNYQSKYPLVNFGAACGGQTAAMVSQAPGLLSCPDLAADIKTCQETYGKPVLLSIGGATASIGFTEPSQASDFADVLWELFGPPGNLDIDLRPFGNVTVDGFNFNNEDHIPTNWDVLGSTLRTNYATASTIKPFYLSSAPQCPFSDASTPLALLQMCDFVFVQFYNNPTCEIGSKGFLPSIQQWSSALSTSNSTSNSTDTITTTTSSTTTTGKRAADDNASTNTTSPIQPRFYLGAPAWSEAGPSAFAGIGLASNMEGIVAGVRGMELPNFGGVMFWDGPEGEQDQAGGKSIIAWTKMGLDATSG